MEPRDHQLKVISVATGALMTGEVTLVKQSQDHTHLRFWLYCDVWVVSLLFFFFSCTPKLSKKYGPIYSIHMGPRKVVVLSGYDTVKDALVNYGNQFGERSRVPIFERLFDGKGNDPYASNISLWLKSFNQLYFIYVFLSLYFDSFLCSGLVFLPGK